ncbi:GNAT family N-acetyltransferase [Rheinheimera sp. 4Y26]|uniref:GNAT family N-acetyltransferase n=1 Tax=Rheinheimera sp. 4Y26 TaxID=2977811 RepID=UPI0021B129E6|nr:GNAT family N-acetyltransferase [Rheinheimera sp. 4Y26]MCT6699433.1 GNAT family N-acetyltransferase [Rheinheimera sp. 4Y26]
MFKSAWDKLNTDLYQQHPYFDSRFIEAMLQYFAHDAVWLCVHQSGGVIDGMLLVQRKGVTKWSLFLPAQAQVTPLLLQNPAILAQLLPLLPGFTLGLDLPCQDPAYSPINSDSSPLQATIMPHALTINVDVSAGSFADYLQRRSKKFRQNLQRRFDKVQQVGLHLTLNCFTKAAEMEHALTQFGALESKGWKEKIGTAVHLNNRQGQFYLQLLQNFAKTEQACVYQLCLNDQPVAMELCIASAQMLILLKTAYDEDFSAYSPGRLLLYLLLQREFLCKRVQTVEFYTSADHNDLAWADGQRWISHHMLLRNPAVRYCHQFLKSR